jgi:hypothetical protein
MNTPTPTPRTDVAWSSSFDGKQLSAGQTARALRECSQKLETELAALRAEVERLTKQAVFDGDHIHTLNAAFATRAEVTDANARAERAEAAETVALAHWNKELERAMKAEAELARLARPCGWPHCEPVKADHAELATEREKSERYRLATLKLDADLAVERARLDFLGKRDGAFDHKQWGDYRHYWGKDFGPLREIVDAAIKEGAK